MGGSATEANKLGGGVVTKKTIDGVEYQQFTQVRGNQMDPRASWGQQFSQQFR